MDVLIVDDDVVSARIVAKHAESLGHTAHVVNDGAQAWRQLSGAHAYQVVVSGMYQPGLTGIELCQLVREQSGRYVAFIFLTAAGDKASQLRGMHAGADDYLTKPVNPHDLELRFVAAERLVALYDKIDRQASELRRLNHKLYDQGRLDAVTGVPNRLRLEEDAEHLYAQAARLGLGFSLAMIDVDDFKAFNDAYGHPSGDKALRAIASTISESSRGGDQIYRYGGEEFVLVIQTDDLEVALRVTERVRQTVKRLAIPHAGSDAGVVTVSIGVATMRATTPRPIADVVERADAAMYRAKRDGKDRVHAYEPKHDAASGRVLPFQSVTKESAS